MKNNYQYWDKIGMAFCFWMVLLLVGNGSMVEAKSGPTDAAAAFQQLEADHQTRIGVYAWNTEDGSVLRYRAQERFPYCSTFKVLLVGELLRQNDLEKLNENIMYTQADILSYAPVTGKHLATGMTLAELCSAALRLSDNTAANLLLRYIGGMRAFRQSLFALNDKVTIPVRQEPELNESLPGDWRDTSTPEQMALDFAAYTKGDILSAEKRRQLLLWMMGNPFTDSLIRAGVPVDWQVVDKSGGSSLYGTRNDIALLLPPGHQPIVLVIMTTHSDSAAKSDDALVAAAAKIAVAAWEK